MFTVQIIVRRTVPTCQVNLVQLAKRILSNSQSAIVQVGGSTKPAADTRSFSQNVCYVSSSPSTQPSRSSSIFLTTRAGTPATTV